MATISRTETERDYPTSDGKPMAETDVHRQVMVDLIDILQDRYAADPNVYVSGDLLLFYEPGNKRRHVAPDVFVVFDVPKRDHLNYLTWLEGKAPDFIVEVTSKTTRAEDQKKKRDLYRDVLRVPEYFLFDPLGDYLRPQLQGYRLVDGVYLPIAPIAGRLPSELIGIHLERSGSSLRLYDPATGRWLLTPRERAEESDRARLESMDRERRADRARLEAEERERRSTMERDAALAELERLKRELEAAKRVD
ncbi:MAG: Uma2 family endonuclease [Isosphaeraceae bacterium]